MLMHCVSSPARPLLKPTATGPTVRAFGRPKSNPPNERTATSSRSCVSVLRAWPSPASLKPSTTWCEMRTRVQVSSSSPSSISVRRGATLIGERRGALGTFWSEGLMFEVEQPFLQIPIRTANTPAPQHPLQAPRAPREAAGEARSVQEHSRRQSK